MGTAMASVVTARPGAILEEVEIVLEQVLPGSANS